MEKTTQGIPGIRVTSPRVNLIAAATPLTVLDLTVPTGQVPRTAFIKKVMIYNGQPADVIVAFGTGLVAFTPATRLMPRIRAIAGFHTTLEEDELPSFRFEASITAQASAAGAGDLGVEIQIEAEVVG